MKKSKWLSIVIGSMSFGSPALFAQSELYFDTNGAQQGLNGGNVTWSASSSIWNANAFGSTNPGTSIWTPEAIASFQSNGASTVTLDGTFALSGLQLWYPTTSITFGGTGTLQLKGGSNTIRVDDQSQLTFGTGVTLELTAKTTSTILEWNTTSNSVTTVNGVVSGALGNATTLDGGWRIGGGGRTIFNNANTYSGLIRMSGNIEMAHANAFTAASKILLENGVTLKWISGITTDLSSKLAMVDNASATLDIGSNNVSFTTALKGNNVEYIKRGSGTLMVAANSTFTGKWIVESGVLKSAANTDLNSNGFGAGGNILEVKSGATLDLNHGHAFNYNNVSKQYVAYLEGKGVADTSNTTYGGFHGAVTNSGGLSATNSPFSDIILTGDTTLSGKMGNTGARWGFNKINANGHTLTIVNGNGLSWAVGTGNATMVHDIVIDQGRLWADSTDFGDANYSIFVNGNKFGSGTAIGELGGWNGGKVINKKVVLNGGRVVVEGNSGSVTVSGTSYTNYGVGTTLDNFMSLDLNAQITLLSGNTALTQNEFLSGIAVKDIKLKGQVTGDGGFYFHASQTTLTQTPITSNVPDTANSKVMNRYATLFITHADNNFTGMVAIGQGLVRMSDGTNSGKLGAGQSNLEFRSITQTGIFDLFGTNQSIAALKGDGANSFVQNNRSNSTSKLTLGTQNASGSFAGVIRDYGTMLSHNYAIANEGSAGAILGIEKVGSGTQTLTGINTFTGNTLVSAGHLQIGAGNTQTSTAQLGSSAITVASGATLSGNGQIGGGAKQILINTGGTLKVGVDGSTIAQTLKINSALKSLGIVQFDLFQYTAGGGANTNSDFLSILQNVKIELGGNLVLNNASSSNSTTWTAGTWFRLVDWGTTVESNRTITDWNLSGAPTLAGGLEWKTDQLATLGRIYIGAVPEPSHAALALLGICAVTNRRRRN